jgi:hypothetical protein
VFGCLLFAMMMMMMFAVREECVSTHLRARMRMSDEYKQSTYDDTHSVISRTEEHIDEEQKATESHVQVTASYSKFHKKLRYLET